MIHSFLLIGQSNMAGRGLVNEVEPIKNRDLLVLRNGRWQPMYTPVNPDRRTSGVSLAESFADCYAKDRGVKVGLIPCADGGSSLDMWQVGGLLFDHACYMAELASRTSTIAGVLWHQGESDCAPEKYPLYEEKLTVVFDALQKKLGLYDVPFLLGGLGDFLVLSPDFERAEKFRHYDKVNEALRHVAATRARTGFVSAEGLSSNPDCLHFSAAALREFGVRYYEEFLKLEDKSKVFKEKVTEDAAIRTELDPL